MDKHVKYRYVAKQVFFFFLEQVKPHQWMEVAGVAGKGWANDKDVYYLVNKPLPATSISEDNACG